MSFLAGHDLGLCVAVANWRACRQLGFSLMVFE